MIGCEKAEEIENAAIIIPRSMCASVIINGFLGLGMLIAVLFCLGNLDNALSTPTGFPFIEIFRQATNSTSGGTVMVSPQETSSIDRMKIQPTSSANPPAPGILNSCCRNLRSDWLSHNCFADDLGLCP